MTVLEHQQAIMPREDLKPYAGQWVALRDGHVVASDLDPVALRDRPDVQDTDTLMPVPPPGSDLLIL
jgi:Family of unknown function (DUF5678)